MVYGINMNIRNFIIWFLIFTILYRGIGTWFTFDMFLVLCFFAFLSFMYYLPLFYKHWRNLIYELLEYLEKGFPDTHLLVKILWQLNSVNSGFWTFSFYKKIMILYTLFVSFFRELFYYKIGYPYCISGNEFVWFILTCTSWIVVSMWCNPNWWLDLYWWFIENDLLINNLTLILVVILAFVWWK